MQHPLYNSRSGRHLSPARAPPARASRILLWTRHVPTELLRGLRRAHIPPTLAVLDEPPVLSKVRDTLAPRTHLHRYSACWRCSASPFSPDAPDAPPRRRSSSNRQRCRRSLRLRQSHLTLKPLTTLHRPRRRSRNSPASLPPMRSQTRTNSSQSAAHERRKAHPARAACAEWVVAGSIAANRRCCRRANWSSSKR